MTNLDCFLLACRENPVDAAIVFAALALCALAFAATAWAVMMYDEREDDVFL